MSVNRLLRLAVRWIRTLHGQAAGEAMGVSHAAALHAGFHRGVLFVWTAVMHGLPAPPAEYGCHSQLPYSGR